MLLNILDEEVRVNLKEYACIQVSHHKEVPKAIADMQNLGCHLHTYQATGYGADVKHCLLFEKGDWPPLASVLPRIAIADCQYHLKLV